jgi:hypothetical protein
MALLVRASTFQQPVPGDAHERRTSTRSQDLMIKQFRLSEDQIKSLAEGYGGCIASDKVTVDGHLVGFMYREAPDHGADSGWRFMAGSEDDAYMDNPDNLGVYDVNTIANYDPRIIPFLDAPEGSAFERKPGSDRFVAVADWLPDEA